MKEIKIAVAGVGNCASNFIQGIEYYRTNPYSDVGLTHRVIGGYDVTSVRVVAAFDIAENKVGIDLNEAIFSKPNNTEKLSDLPKSHVMVQKGPTLDGWDIHFKEHIIVSQEPDCDIKKVLKDASPDILVILLPTASEKACYYYAKSALELGISVINGTPVLISHDNNMQELATTNEICIIGDDFKSQIGGTILHNSILHLLEMRGIKIDRSYQINYAGNMDFLNLVARGATKHKSKKNGIKARTAFDSDISINITYIENQEDTKTCKINIEGRLYGGCKVKIEAELVVVDSANASGVLIDAIRCIMISKEKKQYGVLVAPSAFYMKSPIIQMSNELAHRQVEQLFNGE